jgi:hypothetical protein
MILRKNNITIILIMVVIVSFMTLSLMTLTSCSKNNDDNAEIQLWYYDYGLIYDYSTDMRYLIDEIQYFCQKNSIPIKLYRYDKETLSYEDYVLKRNLAAADGNMIIIEDAKYIWDLSKHHADYTKLENYNNLFDEYKDKFCIPIGIKGTYNVIDSKILEYYGIKLNKYIITYDEYLEIKQVMKEKGAKFSMNAREYIQKIEYFQNKYDLLYLNDTSEILNNTDKFRSSLKSTITEICDDFIRDGEVNKLVVSELVIDYNTYDENSSLNLYKIAEHTGLTAYFWLEKDSELILDNILVADVSDKLFSPCFYMNKKITNQRIWELANFITSEGIYKIIIPGQAPGYLPVRNDKVVREVLELDDNLKYKGKYKVLAEQGNEKYIKISNIIDEISELTMKNKEGKEFLSNKFFINKRYFDKIKKIIETNLVILSENNFDYKNKEINKILDKEINEFVKNFNIHND